MEILSFGDFELIMNPGYECTCENGERLRDWRKTYPTDALRVKYKHANVTRKKTYWLISHG